MVANKESVSLMVMCVKIACLIGKLPFDDVLALANGSVLTMLVAEPMSSECSAAVWRYLDLINGF